MSNRHNMIRAAAAFLILLSALPLTGCDTALRIFIDSYRTLYGAETTAVTDAAGATADAAGETTLTAAETAAETSAVTEEETADEGDPEPAGLIVLDMLTGLYSDKSDGFGDEDVTDYTEIRYICDLLISETNNKFDYYAEEIYFDNPDILFNQYTGDLAVSGIPVTVKRFSGFSYAGQYWDEPDRYTLFIAEDRLFFKSLDGGSDFFRTRDENAERYHVRETIKEQFASAYNTDFSSVKDGLCGEWVCVFEDGYSYLSFEKDGGFTLLDNRNDIPAKVYLGAWYADDSLLAVLCEQIGWAAMPYNDDVTYTLNESGTLVITESESGSSLIPAGEYARR